MFEQKYQFSLALKASIHFQPEYMRVSKGHTGTVIRAPAHNVPGLVSYFVNDGMATTEFHEYDIESDIQTVSSN